jgi:hypothetical protein
MAYSYILTVHFTSEEKLMMLDMDGSPDFNLALEEMGDAEIDVSSFTLVRLDENGKPVETPECKIVDEISLEDQEEYLVAEKWAQKP